MSPYCKSDSGLLENPMRAAIFERVRNQPGLAFSEILRHLKESELGGSVGNGSLMWHLSRLERARLVSSRRVGRHRFYYLASGPWHADLDACSAIQSAPHRDVARVLVGSERATLRELGAKLANEGCKSPSLRRNLRRLRAAGLVEMVLGGHATAYRATPRLYRAMALAHPLVKETAVKRNPVRVGLATENGPILASLQLSDASPVHDPIVCVVPKHGRNQ